MITILDHRLVPQVNFKGQQNHTNKRERNGNIQYYDGYVIKAFIRVLTGIRKKNLENSSGISYSM